MSTAKPYHPISSALALILACALAMACVPAAMAAVAPKAVAASVKTVKATQKTSTATNADVVKADTGVLKELSGLRSEEALLKRKVEIAKLKKQLRDIREPTMPKPTITPTPLLPTVLDGGMPGSLPGHHQGPIVPQVLTIRGLSGHLEAVVQLPDNSVRVVRAGDRISGFGKVVHISLDSVKVKNPSGTRDLSFATAFVQTSQDDNER